MGKHSLDVEHRLGLVDGTVVPVVAKIPQLVREIMGRLGGTSLCVAALLLWNALH